MLVKSLIAEVVTSWRIVVVAWLAITFCGQRLTWCQSAGEMRAEALFREGKVLLEAREFVLACPKLAESYRLDPATGALLALAICNEGAGNLASAWSEYEEVAARSRAEGRNDREKAAQEKVAILQANLATLRVVVAGGQGLPGLRVQRDGKDIEHAAWGAAVPIDVGEHTVDASAPGRRAWRRTIAIRANREKVSVEVPVLELLVPVTSGPTVAAKTEAVVATEPASRTRSGQEHSFTRLQAIGLALGGAGASALVGAGGFAFEALNKKHSYEELGDACSLDCPDLRAANTYGDIATTLAIVGGMVAVAGLTAYLLGSRRSDSRGSGGPVAHIALQFAPNMGDSFWRSAVVGRF